MEHTLACPRCAARHGISRSTFSATVVNAQYIVLACQSCNEQLLFTIALPTGSFTDEALAILAAAPDA